MKYINNTFTIEKSRLTKVIKKFETPIFCYSEKKINENISNFKRSFKSFDQLKNSLNILNDVLKNFSPDKKRMIELAESGYITATDLADYMVRELNYPFRKAYIQTAKIINFAEKNKKKLSELNIKEINKIEKGLTADVLKIFELKKSINSKVSYGGTSFDNIKKMILSYKKK